MVTGQYRQGAAGGNSAAGAGALKYAGSIFGRSANTSNTVALRFDQRFSILVVEGAAVGPGVNINIEQWLA